MSSSIYQGVAYGPSHSSHTTGSTSGSFARPEEQSNTLVSKQRLALLVDQLADERNINIDEVAEEIIQELVDDYVSTTTKVACMLAKHRQSEVLEPQDVKRALKRQPRP